MRAQPIHACGRARALCIVCPGELACARGRVRLHARVHVRRDPRLRSCARAVAGPRRARRRDMRLESYPRRVRRGLAPSPGGGGWRAKRAGWGESASSPPGSPLRGLPTSALKGEVGGRGKSLSFVARLSLLGLLIPIAAPVQTFAADPRFPDWPCVQIKVPELSVAAVWNGPPIDEVGGKWQDDPKVAELVPRLAARRTPLKDAEKLIAEFLGGPAAREQKGKLLFAGLFATLSRERSEVMDGIERFSRRQKGEVDKIRSKTAELHRLQDSHAEPSKIDDLANQLEWDIRTY